MLEDKCFWLTGPSVWGNRSDAWDSTPDISWYLTTWQNRQGPLWHHTCRTWCFCSREAPVPRQNLCHQKSPLVSCAISEEMWNPVGSGILSSELPDLETFTMRLSSGCAPRAASTKARTQSQTWNCCKNVLVTWHPKNTINHVNLNKFLWSFEGGFRSLNFRHQAPSNFAQPKGGTCAGVPNQCGKAAAWSLDTFRVQGSEGRFSQDLWQWSCSFQRTVCSVGGYHPSLFWMDFDWMAFWLSNLSRSSLCIFCWGTIAWFWMPMAWRHRLRIPTCKVIIT